MPKIRVESNGISTLSLTIQRQAQEMQDIERSIASVIANLDIEIGATEGIRYSLNSLKYRSNQQGQNLFTMSNQLNRVNDEFLRTDRNISNQAKGVHYLLEHAGMVGITASTSILSSFGIKGLNKIFGIEENGYSTTEYSLSTIGGGVARIPKESKYEVDWDPLIEVLGSFGAIGGLTGIMLGATQSRKDAAKNTAGFVGWLASNGAKVADKKMIDIFGFKDTVDAIGFDENLAQKLDDYVFNSSANSKNMSVAAKNAKNIGAAAKWAGVAISGIFNFMDNAEEYNEDYSNPRLYAETIGETAIDVGLGILVGAGVAAAAGATAPVWAVGVVSSGVVMGANALSELVFDKDVAELITDTTLDVVEGAVDLVSDIGESAIEAGKTVGKAIGDAYNATVDCISSGWQKVTGWF